MLLEGGISVLKRWSVYYFGNWLLSGEQTWFLREKKSTLEVKTQGNVELWRLLGEQHRHSPSLWQEPGAGRIQLLLLPPTATTAPFLGNDFSSDPLIPAEDSSSVPSQAGSTRESVAAFQGTILEWLHKSLCWDTWGELQLCRNGVFFPLFELNKDKVAGVGWGHDVHSRGTQHPTSFAEEFLTDPPPELPGDYPTVPWPHHSPCNPRENSSDPLQNCWSDHSLHHPKSLFSETEANSSFQLPEETNERGSSSQRGRKEEG